MVAAAGDDHFLTCWQGMQLLTVLLRPLQQRHVASAVCVILLRSVHLQQRWYNQVKSSQVNSFT